MRRRTLLAAIASDPRIPDRALAESGLEPDTAFEALAHARALITLATADGAHEVLETAIEHVRWLVEHAPAIVAGLPFLLVDPGTAPGVHGALKLLWTAQTQRHPDDADVLLNAAEFIWTQDEPLTEALLGRVLSLRPDERQARSRLGLLLLTRARERTGEERRAAARRALEQYDVIAKLPADRTTIDDLLRAADAGLLAGDLSRARERGQAALAAATASTDSFARGHQVHRAHQSLGRAAWEAGEVPLALEHLARSADASTSARMEIFGPETELAETLLAAGHKAAVVDYLRTMRKLCRDGVRVIDEWLANIDRAGRFSS